MKKIDVFDFDKTLYKKDSTVKFYTYVLKRKKKIVKYFPKQVISFIKYKIGIISKIEFKECFFFFLKDIDNVNEMVDNFWIENKKSIRFELIEKSKNLKVVISASPHFLLNKICKEVGIDILIASKVNSRTGKFNGQNCYGEEKVRRLYEKFSNVEVENFYTDSISDIYLARISKKSYLLKKNKIVEWNVNKEITKK